MEKNSILQKLLMESISFSPEEKESLSLFFTNNPEKVEWWISILEEEKNNIQELQKTYEQKVMDMAEWLITESEQEQKAFSRQQMQYILNKEKKEKQKEIEDLDNILSFNI